MAEPSTELFTFCGDLDDLPQSFCLALARLLLAEHEAEKAQSRVDAEAKGDAE